MTAPKVRVPPRVVQAAIVVLIAVVTMLPSSDRDTRITACVICGEQGTSGLLLNILLFVPLGAVLAWSGKSIVRATLAGATLSALIEVTQVFIPGRQPALGDFLGNTAGAAAGAALWFVLPAFLDPAPRRRARLAFAAALAIALCEVVTAIVVQPALPATMYYGQWTPQLGGLDIYQGEVRRVTISGTPIPSWGLESSEWVRHLLLSGEHLTIIGRAGPPTRATAPVFAIADNVPNSVILVGVSREDVVLRYRTTAERLRLNAAELRLGGGMRGLARGAPFRIVAWREGERWCVEAPARGDCLFFSAGSLWRFLSPARVVAPLLADAAFVALLFVPLGYWARGRPGALALGLGLASFVLIPMLAEGVELAPILVAGAASGALAGKLWGVARTRRSLRMGTTPA